MNLESLDGTKLTGSNYETVMGENIHRMVVDR